MPATQDDLGRHSRASAGSSGSWYVGGAAAVLVVLVLRLLCEPRFFFWDDTQLGAFGQWYGLGSRILAGDVTFLSPGSWQGGNYLAEGQWGLWNPLTWLVALSTHAVDNATVIVTVIKFFFFLVLFTGAFFLAREYGADAHWAALGGFTATMGGQTIFMDGPSWVTGLQTVGLFALAWWGLRRHLVRGTSPFPFFVFAYVLITFGYVFGVIELAFILVVALVEAMIQRDGPIALRVLVLGVYSAALTVVVFLPGILTSPVTQRAGNGISNDQFLNLDLGDLATSAVATGVSSVRGYWGDIAPVPLQYVTWLLPVLVIIVMGRSRWWRGLIMPIAVAVFTICIVVGPSVIGPLRYPARMLPYVVLATSVMIAVWASRGWPAHPARARVVAAIVLTAVSGWFGWAAQPDSWRWVALAVLLQMAVIAALFWPWRGRVALASRPVRAAAGLLVASVLVLLPQIAHYRSSPLGNFNVPSSVSAMRAVGDGLDEGIMVVGDVYSLQSHPESYRESLLANLWYLTGKDTVGVYTVLPFTRFAEDLCIDLRGWTCAEALSRLFDGAAPTRADELALNSVVVIKGPGLEARPAAPEGWTVSERPYTWLLTRDEVVERAGGIVNTSEGVSVSELHRDDTSVTFRVNAAPDAGGDIVFSRLAWPGYSTSAGSITDPARGFLLTVHVDPSQAGQTVTISFKPVGWPLMVVGGVLALLVLVGWTAAWYRRRESA